MVYVERGSSRQFFVFTVRSMFAVEITKRRYVYAILARYEVVKYYVTV